MFKGGIPIGKLFGIPLKLHYSWFIIFVVVTWALAAGYFRVVFPDWGPGIRIAASMITSLLFFGSVMAHEVMHSVVSQRQGIPVQGITLFVFGGVSQLSDEPKKASDEFRMAVVGPLTSLVLGGIFWGIYFAIRHSSSGPIEFVGAIVYWLGLINVSLGVFNLVPGFPLDGGRVLRSILWGRGRNLHKATKTASDIGRAVGYLFIFVGVYFIFIGQFFNGIWLAFIGWFLESAAGASYQQLAFKEKLQGHMASEIMSRDCQIISPDVTVDTFVNEQVLSSGRRCFPVVSHAQLMGLVTVHNIKTLPRDQWRTRRVKEVMTDLEKVKSVRPDEDLYTVLHMMNENDINQVPVISDGKLMGMIGRDNILAFISVRQELGD